MPAELDDRARQWMIALRFHAGRDFEQFNFGDACLGKNLRNDAAGLR